MSVLLFFIVLFVLILVHEWGHFIVAKKTGMRVDEFGIGFPPKLFGIKKGETEYTFNALPIGGFVKILGEDGAPAPSSPVTDEVGDDRSEHSEADQGGGLSVQDVQRTFTAKSKWAQAAVLVAGVTMNVLFAWMLFVVVFMVGVPSSVTESEATDQAQLTVTGVLADAPAAQAGVVPGSVITGLESDDAVLEAFTPAGFSEFVTMHADQFLTLSVGVGDEIKQIELTPETGVITDTPDVPAVGVALSLVETVPQPFFAAIKNASVTTVDSLVAITVGITAFVIDAFTFSADLSEVAGPIGIVGLVGDAAEFGLTSLLLFTAFISLNLAVINMLPFPALDGGRLLMVAIEGVIRRPLNPVWVGRVNLLGFALLILLMVVVTVSDVGKLL